MRRVGNNSLPAPSWTIPVIPTAHPSFRRRPESRGARRRPSWTIPVIPQPPTRHSGGGRNPEGRGTWGIPLITKIRGTNHSSDNPRHSNRPPLPAAAGIRVGNPTNHNNHRITVQTTPFAPLRVLRGQSFRPPHTVIPAKAGIQRGGDVGNPTNHNHTNTVQTTPFAPSVLLKSP